MEELLCKQCGSPLEWGDTYDSEGGIMEGYYIERQWYTCPKCDITYCVQLESQLNPPKITHFEEG